MQCNYQIHIDDYEYICHFYKMTNPDLVSIAKELTFERVQEMVNVMRATNLYEANYLIAAVNQCMKKNASLAEIIDAEEEIVPSPATTIVKCVATYAECAKRKQESQQQRQLFALQLAGVAGNALSQLFGGALQSGGPQ
jgi:Ni,Fe-hydrogenase I large subunit